jgi:hypothetical protein
VGFSDQKDEIRGGNQQSGEARCYSDSFIKYGLAFVGGEDKIRTMKEVKVGDIVAIKSGLSQIMAAGEVVERDGKATGFQDKSWLRDFDGWDLSAYCNVNWHVPEKPINTEGLTRATIQKIQQPKHREIVDEILKLPIRPFSPEPRETAIIKDDDLLDHLISKGLRPSSADDLTNTIRKIRLLAKFYYNNEWGWEHIREHETRAFLVVPLLLALGWSEQQLKIELPCSKGKVDIACFSGVFKGNHKECILLVETKDFSSGLDYAPSQARSYSEVFPSCKALLVTNGYCYKLFLRSNEGLFDIKPSAYLNLLQPRDRYPLDPDNVDGALGVLSSLMPNRNK